MIEIKDLKYSYGDHQVLKGISATIEKGEFVSLLGPNGVGKTTLFKCILGLLKDYQGDILLFGKPIKGYTAKELAKEVAYIPQSHTPAFNYSVMDMVLMGTSPLFSPFTQPDKKEVLLANEALEKVGVSHLLHRDYMNLSGGERQLVLLARALAQQSKTLLFDEPTANLDFGNQIRVLQKIKDLTHEGYTVVQSTHQPDMAYWFSSSLLTMKEGKLLSQESKKPPLNEALMKQLYSIDASIELVDESKLLITLPKDKL